MGYGKGKAKITKRRGKPTKSWYNKKYSALELATKAFNAVQYIKGMINCEKKFMDTEGQSLAIDSAGTITLLSGIAQGDNPYDRNGNSILCRGILFKAFLQRNASGLTNQNMRIMIVMDKQMNGTTPTVEDILEGVGTALAPIQPLERDTLGRFQILYSRVFQITDRTNPPPINKFISLQKHIKYTGSGSLNGFRNQIYLVYVGNASTNQPTITYNTRLYYYDN